MVDTGDLTIETSSMAIGTPSVTTATASQAAPRRV
jgi:hypothetical protein